MTLSIYTGLSQAESLIRFQTKNGNPDDSRPKLSAKSSEIIPQSTMPVLRGSSVTRVIEEQQQELETGFKRTRIFEQPDGRRFIKVESLTLTPSGAERLILQQNPSGSISRYEDILDRQTDGNFRRTQRFDDGAGQVQTQITPDVRITDPFVLFGDSSLRADISPSPFAPIRGTQLDLVA